MFKDDAARGRGDSRNAGLLSYSIANVATITSEARTPQNGPIVSTRPNLSHSVAGMARSGRSAANPFHARERGRQAER